MTYSFVIPTYNNKHLLKNTLEALNHQKYFSRKDYDVILVDDGSTDNTKEYIKGININYDLKYYYLKKNNNSSRSKTRNYGWKKSNAEIIIFIDSDIIIKENYLIELDKCFSMQKDILVVGNRLMLTKDIKYNDVVTREVFNKYIFDKNNFDILEFRHFLYETCSYNSNVNKFQWCQIYSCNLAVSKYNLEKTGGFDENIKKWGLEDVELGYSLQKNGCQIVINSKIEVLHQYHGKRRDLVITEDKVEGYKNNIDYFMMKHPKSVLIHKKFLYKFFMGGIPLDKMNLYLNLFVGGEKYTLDFDDRNQLDKIKKIILEHLTRKNTILIINDYIEDTDLEIWIQLLGEKSSSIKYYPASKRLNKVMLKKLKEEKERQKLELTKLEG